MTEQEFRELDKWIHENVFKIGPEFGLMKRGYFYRPNACGYTSNPATAGRWSLEEAKKYESIRGDEDDVTIVTFEVPHYSTDRAASQEVLERCLIKAAESNHAVELMRWKEGGFSLFSNVVLQATAETLPLAICLFAKKLFEKP